MPTGVAFADGSTREFDVVISATDSHSPPGPADAPGLLDDDGYPVAEASEGLYFVGFRESVRGAIFEIARDSRTVARQISAGLEKTGASP